MKKLTMILLALSMMAMSPTSTQPYPPNCGGLFNSCEGWLVTFAGSHKDKDGNFDHLDDINEFVSTKSAQTLDQARTVADFRVNKVQTK